MAMQNVGIGIGSIGDYVNQYISTLMEFKNRETEKILIDKTSEVQRTKSQLDTLEKQYDDLRQKKI